jgi:hypothetical protein
VTGWHTGEDRHHRTIRDECLELGSESPPMAPPAMRTLPRETLVYSHYPCHLFFGLVATSRIREAK